jgi:hypothetical protein
MRWLLMLRLGCLALLIGSSLFSTDAAGGVLLGMPVRMKQLCVWQQFAIQ